MNKICDWSEKVSKYCAVCCYFFIYSSTSKDSNAIRSIPSEIGMLTSLSRLDPCECNIDINV